MRWRRALAPLLLGAGVWRVTRAFRRDLAAAYARIESRTRLVATPFGDVELLEGGPRAGAPVLVVHGSGGGFDQGELLAQAALDADVWWIAPSRFGYLRSTFHPGAGFDEQAHAFDAMLEALGVPRAHVLALSHGGPSALLLAALHPERVASLTLVSAGVASSADESQADANAKGKALTTIFQHDLLYWSMTHALRRPFLALMGVEGAVVDQMTPAQRRLVDELIDFMNPVAPRAAGVRLDNTAVLPNERIAAIRAPTLIVHARDDRLQLHRNAEYAASHIAGARHESFARGGHVVLAVEQEAIRALVREHLERASAR